MTILFALIVLSISYPQEMWNTNQWIATPETCVNVPNLDAEQLCELAADLSEDTGRLIIVRQYASQMETGD